MQVFVASKKGRSLWAGPLEEETQGKKRSVYGTDSLFCKLPVSWTAYSLRVYIVRRTGIENVAIFFKYFKVFWKNV